MTVRGPCLGCDDNDSKCRRDGCPDCCYCGQQLRPDKWPAATRWRAMYGQREARFLLTFFKQMEHEENEIERQVYYNMDDVRVRRVDSATAEEIALYERQVKHSCCGVYDTEVRSPSGILYRVGFSYGH